MGYSTIRFDVADGIATLTLDRPERLNAFTVEMMREMIDAFDRIDADDEVRVVVVTGAGRAFCAGADLSEGADSFDYDELEARQGGGADRKRAPRDGGGLLTLRIFRCTKPVIAAINGHAVGVGATMTLPMDIRIASADAKFGFVFTARGIVPEACSSWFLPRVVGISTALEWMYTSRVFPASEALERGLVRSVHPTDEVLDVAYGIAGEIVRNAAPVSVSLARAMLWRTMGEDHPMAAHRVESAAVRWSGRQPDAREGVTAFLEKRPAEWSMRPSIDMPDFVPWWDEPDFEVIPGAT